MLMPVNFNVKASGGGQTLYVGGQGGGNYTKIQDAIDNASSGDTIYVYSGTYNENVIVNVSINLTGENKDNTTIDGSKNGNTVTITADWVNLSEFTIQNGGEEEDDAGLRVESNYTNITNNIIKDCDASGLFLEGANNNTIFNNTFTNITYTSTIFLWNSSAYNNISKNNITNCGCGICIGNGSHHNNVMDNDIVNNSYGVYLWINTTSNNSIYRNSIINTTHNGLLIEEAADNKIFENQFENNEIGITIYGFNSSNKNMFYHNNFINNTEHLYDDCNQTWDNGYPSGGNYWDDYTGDDMYSGSNQNESSSDGIGDTPYIIAMDDTFDSYPLILPWGEYSPVAEYRYLVENMTVSFNASGSYDRDGTIDSYEWDFGDQTNGTGMSINHTFSEDGGYNVTLTATSNDGCNDTITKHIFIGDDAISPEIINVTSDPACVGFGLNVTINANFTENISGINIAKVNIIYPDNITYGNFTMDKITDSKYSYVFSDTWENGQYNYTVWIEDYANNTNSSAVQSFNASGQVNISIATLKNEYGDNETINITDPPGEQPPIGYELLDDDQVLHMWNNHNSYYFNISNGIQFTNHKDEYWTRNVLMLGYYNNNEWHLIYRTDELSGFNKNINMDNESYVNATLWKNLTYNGYDFRLAIRYYLGVDDADLTVIPYIMNLDEDDIPYVLGFGWEIKDIRIADVESDNYLRIYNGTGFEDILLSQTLDKTITDMGNNTIIRLICKDPPSNHKSRDLYLSWDSNLTYKVIVKSRTGQYNAPVSLFIRIGTLSVDQEKYTMMHWLDSDDWLGIGSSELADSCEGQSQDLKNALDGLDIWSHADNHEHWFILDLGQQYSIKKFRGRSFTIGFDPIDVDIYVSSDNRSWEAAVASNIASWQDTTSWEEVDSTDKEGRYVKVVIQDTEDFLGNRVDWGSGVSPATIFDVYGYPANFGGCSQDGFIGASSTSYNAANNVSWGSVDSTGDTIRIGQEKTFPSTYYIYRGFLFFNTSIIKKSDTINSCKLHFYLDSEHVSLRDLDIVLQNNDSNVYPHDQLQSGDYDKDYYSGDGGSISTSDMMSGNWYNITFNNTALGWISREKDLTKLCLRSNWDIAFDDPAFFGDEYVVLGSSESSFAPYLEIDFHPTQSKIVNAGAYDITGYLLMQIHYYKSSLQRWIVDHTIIEESSPRRINSSETLALDTLFNGQVNTWNLSYDSGLYRVYAAFCDANGFVLRCDDDTFVEASWEFDVLFDSDKDIDGLSDYKEKTRYYTQHESVDSDVDTWQDFYDIDPLVDLEVTLTVKRIYASEYTYTWCEGENWDTSETNTSGSGDGTDWITLPHVSASGGYYTRQNDSRVALDDFAEWDFTVNKPGIYHIWMRSHRYDKACSNVTLWWIDDANVATRIYNRRSDHSVLGTQVMWYQDTDGLPEDGEWKWSWYGVVDVAEIGDYTLKINNTKAYPDPDPEAGLRDDLGWSHGNPEWWMEVDNILITDDPNCIPSGKGIENSNDNTIGYTDDESWDPSDGAPDFYVKTIIAGNSNTSNVWNNKFNILDDWSATQDVPDNVQNVPITIELWEEDPGDDTLCDINGGIGGKKCDITYNLKNGTWWGDDYLGDTDFIGRTCGEVDGNRGYDANVIFTVSQNDKDNDGITYWREKNVFKAGDPGSEPFAPDVTNDRYAVIIGGGASCKLRQTSDVGSNYNPCNGPYLLYDGGSSWTDYTFEVDLMTKEEGWNFYKENIGVIFRYQDASNYYILRWRQHGALSRMFLDKVVNDVRYNIGKEYDLLIKDNWYTINVTLDGNNIKIKRIGNFFNSCRKVFDVTDNSHSSGSIALFCWKNEEAWFDDVRVVNKNGDVLLVEGFDYGIIPSTDWTSMGSGSWIVTPWSTDQEEMYKELDFLYRELIHTFHYDDDDIYYLSAHKWRDADGDSNFDVDRLSTPSNIRHALANWLKGKSDSNDLNFVFFITHSGYSAWNTSTLKSSLKSGFSTSGFDTNRNGTLDDQPICDWQFGLWLLFHGYGNDIGRLVFLIDSCMVGHYHEALGKSGEDRIIITSSSIKEPAELETGQDWAAFSYKFFKEIGDGDTNVLEAFNIADDHVENVNFMSIDVIKEWGYTFWPQDARLDDNGNGKGSDNLPVEGDWNPVFRGGYRDNKMVYRVVPNLQGDSEVTKARIRFNVQLGGSAQQSAELYEFYLYDKNSDEWVSPTGHVDSWNLWDNEDNAYDKNENTKASCTRTEDDRYPYGSPIARSKGWFWTPYLVLTLDDSIDCNWIKFKAKSDDYCNRIDVDLYYSGDIEGNLAGMTGL